MQCSPNLNKLGGIAHGFFGRQGGVSSGLYGSLNCGEGSQDDAQAVAENRERVRSALRAKQLLSLYQVHSAEVITVNQPWQEKPQADAMVTNQPLLALGILTADCGPVLFADAQAGIIGAAHAGWKGALGGVLENTIAAMESLGAQAGHIHAALGPTIAQASYQVDAGFYERFCEAGPDNQAFFTPSQPERFDPFPTQAAAGISHYQFNLPAYIRHRLSRYGLASVHDMAADTYTNEATYFSYRRTTHQAEADYGRQISTIMLKD